MMKFKIQDLTLTTITLFFVLILIISCDARDMTHPNENKVWAQMSVNTSSLLIAQWEKELNNKNYSSEKVEELEKQIKEEKLWLKDMESILNNKKPSGKGIAMHRKTAQQQISELTEGRPDYCNLKNVLRIYDHLEVGKPIGKYSCE